MQFIVNCFPCVVHYLRDTNTDKKSIQIVNKQDFSCCDKLELTNSTVNFSETAPNSTINPRQLPFQLHSVVDLRAIGFLSHLGCPSVRVQSYLILLELGAALSAVPIITLEKTKDSSQEMACFSVNVLKLSEYHIQSHRQRYYKITWFHKKIHALGKQKHSLDSAVLAYQGEILNCTCY